MPSIPRVILRFKLGNQKSLTTNWKFDKDFWKKIQRNKKPINGTKEKFKANILQNFSFFEKKTHNTPKRGEIKI